MFACGWGDRAHWLGASQIKERSPVLFVYDLSSYLANSDRLYILFVQPCGVADIQHLIGPQDRAAAPEEVSSLIQLIVCLTWLLIPTCSYCLLSNTYSNPPARSILMSLPYISNQVLHLFLNILYHCFSSFVWLFVFSANIFANKWIYKLNLKYTWQYT